MRVMYEQVAGIDVHKDMIKVGIRTPGHRAWTRPCEVLEYRTGPHPVRGRPGRDPGMGRGRPRGRTQGARPFSDPRGRP